MKTLLTLPLLLLSLVSFPSWSETFDDLVWRDGLYYKKFSDVPFTGEIKSQTEKGWIREGKRDGHWVIYFKNGQLSSKGGYKNGTWDGHWVRYWDNGQLFSEGNYENGRENGLWVSYTKSGALMSRGEFKNGKREGLWVAYDWDGSAHKALSGLYKDGVKISD
jgi:hypothetical protein